MSLNSETELNEEFLDEWLTEQGFPTLVPLQMKLLAYGGHLWIEQHEIAANTGPKGRGRPNKEISDYARRADVFNSVQRSLQEWGFKDLTKTEVIKVCIRMVKILHAHGEISDEECSLWTRVNTTKSILDHLPEGFAELDALSQK